MRKLGGTIEEMLNINFGSTGDDDLEPRSMCGGICQRSHDIRTTLSAATLIKCVNDEDERFVWEARKFTDKVNEESVLH